MAEWKFKQDDETWEQYSARQTARIMLLQTELNNYRNLIDSLKNVRFWVNRTVDCYERDVEGKESCGEMKE